ncbi:heme ABC exporter ATP-binding protein CcmA [Caulobacter sp. NIBR1757]|uniref:heme ABC exporter ATP-binding protein CcmA n=1 Tax=Caulobacter sp. NIBR1757 TaxID=3016000 RepID=UPI0022F03F23|nr:heme ABC exporter ATP-binding protein CcmA [Caulobacter sp. NIBR1757]WGM37399.1 Cytochrome c biogenesis ATP-binding export protein CcmA [Caulobacter sp. NIBR1757]
MISGLSVKGLSVQRGERVLFRDLAFSLPAGEAIALTGANGSGKTSLLRVIAGLLRPAAGDIVFEGAAEADVARHESVHLLGHADGLKGGRTALEELSFQAGWLGGDDEGVARAIEQLALTPLLDLEVRRLSAGQRRRLAMARLIAAPRPLWLLDEPMAPLDTARRGLLAGMMQAHLAGGGLILAAVHDPLPIPARVLEIGA